MVPDSQGQQEAGSKGHTAGETPAFGLGQRIVDCRACTYIPACLGVGERLPVFPWEFPVARLLVEEWLFQGEQLLAKDRTA